MSMTFSCSCCVLVHGKELTVQSSQPEKPFHFLPDQSFHECSAELRPLQTAAPLNTELHSWKVQQVVPVTKYEMQIIR